MVPTASLVANLERSLVRRYIRGNKLADLKLTSSTVTCVDPRIIPETFLGFRLPGEAPIGNSPFALFASQHKRLKLEFHSSSRD